jgi:hypothetical protein
MANLKAEILEFPRQIERLFKLIDRTREEIIIVVPFYKKQMVDVILKRLPKNVKLRVLTRADSDSDITALESFHERGKVKTARNLHAKVIIFDKSVALVSSLNLSEYTNADMGVLLRGDICKKLVNLVNRWWNAAKELNKEDINRLKKKTNTGPKSIVKGSFFSLGGHIPVSRIPFKVQKPTSAQVENQDILININWSPHDYKKLCTQNEKISEIQVKCCHEWYACNYVWERSDGCASSTLFKDYWYATSRNAIKKGRLAFFVAKNPHLNYNYYMVGFLYMKSDKPTNHMKWGKMWVYGFDGDKDKSIKFPRTGNNVIRLDRKFCNTILKSLEIDWRKKPNWWRDASYLGLCLRKNPRYISRNDAIAIIREYYQRTRNQKAREILEDFAK